MPGQGVLDGAFVETWRHLVPWDSNYVLWLEGWFDNRRCGWQENRWNLRAHVVPFRVASRRLSIIGQHVGRPRPRSL